MRSPPSSSKGGSGGGRGRSWQQKRPRRSELERELMDVILQKDDYRSSEDEDYAPAGAGAGAGSTPKQQWRRGAGGTLADEDVPLSQRKRRLLQAAAGSPAQRPGQGSTSGPAGPTSAHLPPECIARVLRFAVAGNAAPVLAAAACVCRTWRQTVAEHPSLWAVADLSYPRCKPTDAIVARCAARSWGRLAYLSLSGCDRLTDASLQAVAQHCTRLTHLDLSYCTNFSEAGLTSALGALLLRRREPGGGARPLERINLSCIQVKPRASGIDQLLRQVLLLQSKNEAGPVLQELLMEGCPLLTHQGLRTICDASFEQRRPLLGALRVLRLTQSAGARSNFSINIERLQYACPQLEELGLNGLGGRVGWDFNQTPPELPPYQAAPPAAAAGTVAADAGGSAGAAGLAGTAVAAAEEEGGGGAAPAGFPQLRSCEVGTTIVHSEGTLSGRSQLTDGALVRLISHSLLLEHLDLNGVERLSAGVLEDALHPAAPLRRVALARSSVCCDAAVQALADRHGDTLEAMDLSWGGSRITDLSAMALVACPNLRVLGLAGTAVGEAGVAAVVAVAAERGALPRLRLDINSCRGVGREVRQAAAQGMDQLKAALGL